MLFSISIHKDGMSYQGQVNYVETPFISKTILRLLEGKNLRFLKVVDCDSAVHAQLWLQYECGRLGVGVIRCC